MLIARVSVIMTASLKVIDILTATVNLVMTANFKKLPIFLSMYCRDGD